VGVYDVKNEEVIKWLAVGMCLAMIGMAVMPAVSVGKLMYYYAQNDLIPNDPFALNLLNTAVTINAGLVGLAVGGPVGAFIGIGAGVIASW